MKRVFKITVILGFLFLLLFSCGKRENRVTQNYESQLAQGIAQERYTFNKLPPELGKTVSDFTIWVLDEKERPNPDWLSNYDLRTEEDNEQVSLLVEKKSTEKVHFLAFVVAYDPNRFSPLEFREGEIWGEPDEYLSMAVFKFRGFLSAGVAPIGGKAVPAIGLAAKILFKREPFDQGKLPQSAPPPDDAVPWGKVPVPPLLLDPYA